MSKKVHTVVSKESAGPVLVSSPIVPRLLRIPDAARYLSATFSYVETLVRERTLPVVVLGKRHLLDVRDLDDYIDQKKAEQAA